MRFKQYDIVKHFKYETLDNYIRNGITPDADVKTRIDNLHEKNKFKLETIPTFDYFYPDASDTKDGE